MSTSVPPPEIILSRLPVKSLLRFRCVSKDWCDLIDGSYFIKQHLNRSIASNSDVSLFLKKANDGALESFHLDSTNKAVKIKTPFTKKGVLTEVIGCCHGLLLVRTNHGVGATGTLFLYNPSTKERRVLPSVSAEDGLADYSDVHRGDFCFGYDSVNDDYKVFNILQTNDGYGRLITYEPRVYSLRSNSWRPIENFFCDNERSWGAYVNGAFHKLYPETFSVEPTGIVAFDIGTEARNIFPLPTDYMPRKALRDPKSVKVFGGCLCFVGVYDPPTYFMRGMHTIWVMKEYGVEESWTMLLSITSLENYWCVQPTAYSTECTDEVLVDRTSERVWYDLRAKTTRKVFGLPSQSISEICVGSLVPLKGCENRGEKEPGGRGIRGENEASQVKRSNVQACLTMLSRMKKYLSLT